MSNRQRTSGVLLVACSAVSFGFMPVFAKIAYAAGASTYTLLFLRFSIAAAVMFLLLFAKGLRLPSPREALAFLLLGALGYVGESFCYFSALNYVSSGVAALLLYTFPVLVMIGSAIFLQEKITPRKVLVLALALLGAFVIIGADFEANITGIVLAVLSAVFYAGYILVSSRVVKAGQGIQSSAFIMLGAAAVYGAANLFAGFQPPAQISGIAAVLLIALISTGLAFWAFLTGLEKTGPTTASLISILEPVVTVISSAVILAEPLTLNIVIGGGLVLAALIAATVSPPAA